MKAWWRISRSSKSTMSSRRGLAANPQSAACEGQTYVRFVFALWYMLMTMWMSQTSWCNQLLPSFMLLFEHCVMMSGYITVVYVNCWSWHVHGSHSVCLLKPGVAKQSKRLQFSSFSNSCALILKFQILVLLFSTLSLPARDSNSQVANSCALILKFLSSFQPYSQVAKQSKRLQFFVWRSLRDLVSPRREEHSIGLRDHLREGKSWKRHVLSGLFNGE
jgi:hypothetical protein